MSVHTKREFADLCGMPTNRLAIYISRAKVIVSEAGTIDDSVPQNSLFLQKRKGKEKSVPDKKTTDVKEKDQKQKSEYASKILGLEQEKKALDIDKTKREIELLNDRRDKQRGKLIPLDQLKPLLAQHFKDITVSFIQGVDNILPVICKKVKLNINDQAALRLEIVQIINDSVHNSIDSTQKSINLLVNEVIQQRGVGERL